MSDELPYAELVRAAVSTSHPTSAVLRTLTSAIGEWAALVTPSGHVIEEHPPRSAGPAAVSLALSLVEPAKGRTAVTADADADGTSILAVCVGLDRRPLGVLVIAGREDFDTKAYRFGTEAGALLSRLMRDVRASKAASRIVRDCIARLVFAGHTASATELAADLGVAAPPARPHVACFRRTEGDTEGVLDRLESAMPRGSQHLLAYAEGAELWILLTPVQVEGVLREGRGLLAEDGALSMLISEQVPVTKLFHRRQSWGRVLRQRPVGSFIDVSQHSGSTPSDWVKALQEQGGPDVLAAVVEYLRARGRWESAAEALSVHRNTLRYRIATAQRLLEVDIDHPDVASRLWLTLRDVGLTA
ncbi:helix-turn-helix domain-containing protein [Streptomyces sp. NPDC058221]|uniref:helix-turn-helix domain-containing protein n=1 Tax=Streptomyces sp. NPDC058221 TaxID=3346388 RepID=UPI0036E057F0